MDRKVETNQVEVDSLELACEKFFQVNQAPVETLVIQCADPRYRLAFQEFIDKELGIDHHALISLAGGVGPFVLFNPDSDLARQMIDQLRLFIEGAGIKEIALLNHTDCRWYAKALPQQTIQKISERQIADIQRFDRMIQKEFSEVKVRAFLAVPTEKGVRFKKVPVG